MKKIMLALSMMALFAAPAMALDFNDTTPLAVNGITILKPSNKVNGTVINGVTQFSAVCKHLNGTRNFATSSTDTKIFWFAVTDANKGTTTLEITLSASDTSNFASWQPL